MANKKIWKDLCLSQYILVSCSIYVGSSISNNSPVLGISYRVLESVLNCDHLITSGENISSTVLWVD